MAGDRVRLNVRARERLGSAESRRLRKTGFVPGVLYGHGGEARAFAVAERELRRVLAGAHGLHTILDITVDGDGAPRSSIVKDYQLDPLRSSVSHLDLQEVRLDEAIQTQVIVELVGEPAGVKAGGVLSQVTREINVEALPLNVPDRLELDVSALAIGDSARLADVPPREGVTYLDDPDETVIATVTPPTRVEMPEDIVDEAEDAAAGVPEGEEASEKASEQPADSDAAGSPGTSS